MPMGLDYPYTCPNIDGTLKDVKHELTLSIEQIIDDCLSGLKYDTKQAALNWYVEDLYQGITQYFEDVRSANENLRDTADCQIDMLETQLSTFKDEQDVLQDTINELEAKITELENKISSYTQLYCKLKKIITTI